MVSRTRGVRRPRIDPAVAERLPPGQFLTRRMPAYQEGAIPAFDPLSWDLRVVGLVERELRLTWDEVQRLPRVEITADTHCVARWSKLDNVWEGVPFRDVAELAGARPEARFVMVGCDGGYDANLPIEAVLAEDVLLALKLNGEDLAPGHGYPLRLVVPSRYAWKSAKWVRTIEFMAEDRPGFWERYGYHMNGDVSREERFADEPVDDAMARRLQE
jgi:DMSO/TMAO reductase YedYZ molybdopterin-dependent catalytic subunit